MQPPLCLPSLLSGWAHLPPSFTDIGTQLPQPSKSNWNWAALRESWRPAGGDYQFSASSAYTHSHCPTTQPVLCKPIIKSPFVTHRHIHSISPNPLENPNEHTYLVVSFFFFKENKELSQKSKLGCYKQMEEAPSFPSEKPPTTLHISHLQKELKYSHLLVTYQSACFQTAE